MNSPSAKCPTCGREGEDVFTYNYDAGWWEADCGDEWHDRGEA